jgi:hypothetical protein
MIGFDGLRAYVAGVYSAALGYSAVRNIELIRDKIEEAERGCAQRLMEYLKYQLGMLDEPAKRLTYEILRTRIE